MARNRKVKRRARAAPEPETAVETPRARAPKVKTARGDGPSREIAGILALGAALFTVLALFSLQVGGGTLMGPFGRSIASMVYAIAGLGSYVIAAGAGFAAVRLLLERHPIVPVRQAVGVAIGLVSLATLMHLIGASYRVAGYGPGGALGESVAEVFRAMVSTAGTALVAVLGLAVAAVVTADVRLRAALIQTGRWAMVCLSAVGDAARTVGRWVGEVVRAILPERDHDEYEGHEDDEEEFDAYEIDQADAKYAEPPIIAAGGRGDGVPVAAIDGDTERVDEDEAARLIQVADSARKGKKARKTTKLEDAVEEAVLEAEVADEVAGAVAAADAERKTRKGKKATAKAAAEEESAAAPIIIEDKSSKAGKAAELVAAAVTAESAEAGEGPVIVEPRYKHADKKEMEAKEKEADKERLDFIPLHAGNYKLPSINLLNYDETQEAAIDKASMLELSARLAQTLENYGVKGEVVAIRPGPVVTMYEFAPAPGTRVSKIVNLNDDLAMALEALRVRIVAPIPGKAVVGIEVPNKGRETVYLKEILADEIFRKKGWKLPMSLGKDIEGGPAVVDLAKMPHLLVAGTTGSGKSVAVNAMITSLLYNSSPEDVRMIMVDPKMLELSIYEGIPHLLLPVVTDPKKANLALRWAVDEMERRYDLLANMGVRDIISYNAKLEKQTAKFQADKLQAMADEAARLAEDDEEAVEITEERQMDLPALKEPPKRLPYIVIVIDEFADLMMCAPKEVETSVARIAQKARAAGIHLILATQRPSVDVITGLIKANFPSRIAFHVTSKIDSRTILDQGGAEALLGAGDMLFSDRGASPTRFHGCYVDEDEIHRVVEFLKTQARPVYNMEILKPREEDGGEEGGGGGGGDDVDEMYDRAVQIVTETRQASISMIQRRLRVGYNRAARMVEHMEAQGVVGPPDHTNKREVLVNAA